MNTISNICPSTLTFVLSDFDSQMEFVYCLKRHANKLRSVSIMDFETNGIIILLLTLLKTIWFAIVIDLIFLNAKSRLILALSLDNVKIHTLIHWPS